jgi:hypothetical protein
MSGPDVGFEQSQWLSVAVTDTNGKGTTAELVERLLLKSHGRSALPRQVCSFKEQTEDLEYLFPRIELLLLEATGALRPETLVTRQNAHSCESALKLKGAEASQSHLKAISKPPQSLLIANRLRPQSHPKATLKPPQSHPKATPKPPSNRLIRSFEDQRGVETTYLLRALGLMRIAAVRPAAAVLRSLAPGGPARYGSAGAHVRANARLCPNQRDLHWGVVQSEALARLREPSLPVPATVIAVKRRAAAVAAFQARVPGARGWRANLCGMGSFYSLHRRGFVANSRGRSGEKCDFRRRSFACTGLFELGSVSRPLTSW